MDVSLDDYIRGGKANTRSDNLSLDEYINLNNIVPAHDSSCANNISKFDRYKHQDEGDDEMEEDDLPLEMPKLIPFQPKTMPKKPVHQRLGTRNSICESIHTSQMNLLRPPRFKPKKSVQQRLGKTWVNPAIVERNRIAMHTITSFAPQKSITSDAATLLKAFTQAIKHEAEPESESEPEKKYNMKLQREISSLQGKELYYTCPGGYVVSSDGPGLQGATKIPNHSTEMSMNQRFA